MENHIIPSWNRQCRGEVLLDCPEWCDNYVHLEHKGNPHRSHMLRVMCDDAFQHRFYSRDYTSSGIPFVDETEVYWSGWWFESRAEALAFIVVARDYGAIGVWQPSYKRIMKDRDSRR
ncbi:hypothetical protein KAR91_28140 [Candidatus Pacearchaeota archaeon]|nr:hypothetical protein [Candidatus Pacearchaeota archaeon]